MRGLETDPPAQSQEGMGWLTLGMGHSSMGVALGAGASFAAIASTRVAHCSEPEYGGSGLNIGPAGQAPRARTHAHVYTHAPAPGQGCLPNSLLAGWKLSREQGLWFFVLGRYYIL